LLDRLRNILVGSGSTKTTSDRESAANGRSLPTGPPVTRQSNGLDQFFGGLRDRGSLSLIDFAGASQENISFITSLGHRLLSQDFVRAIEQTFGHGDPVQAQADPVLLDEFIAENLSFPPDSFDGALVWDALQFLSPHALQLAVDRLYDALRPDAYLFAFFNADEKARDIPVYNYRISDQRTVSLTRRGLRPAAQFFNNRSIEKLFHRFQTVKFFLARDSLREVIVRR